MYELRINGTALQLYPGTEVELERQHPITNLGLQDDFTLEFEVPVRGNEALLQHVHRLNLRERVVRFSGAELWRNGTLRSRGVVDVTQSGTDADGSLSVSYAVSGFISSLAGVRLREVDYGPDIALFAAEGDAVTTDAAARNAQTWPDTRYKYPMIHNPEAYANENPDWYNAGNTFDPTIGYPVGAHIQWETGSPVRRTQVYRANAITNPNENPDNTPAKWDLVSQGIINAMDPTTATYGTNLLVNKHAYSPQFFLKDVLTRALAHVGYRVEGAFLDDEATHPLLIYNNQLLDRAEETNDLLVSQVGTLSYAVEDADYGRIVFTDETTPPNTDADNIHSTAGGEVELTVESWYRFRAHVKVTTDAPCRIRVEAVWAATGNVFMSGTSGSGPGDQRTSWDFIWQGSRYMQGGELNEPFYFRLKTVNAGNEPNPIRRAMEISNGWLQVSRGTGNPLNVFSNIIRPAQHVPDITLEHLLLDLRQWFNLRITPDITGQVVRMDYQQDILVNSIGWPTQPTTDLTPLLRSPVRLQLNEGVRRLRLQAGTGKAEDLPSLSATTDIGAISNEFFDLPVATTDLQRTRISSTGQVLVSRLYDTNSYAWYPVGTLNPDATVGTGTTTEEVLPELAPIPMDLVVAPDGSLCLMPSVRETCSTDLYGLGEHAPGLYLMWDLGMRPNSSTIYNYALASPYRHDQLGNIVGTVALTFDPDDANSCYRRYWKRWAERWVRAEVLVADLEADTLENGGTMPLQRYLLKHTEVLIEHMRLVYTNGPERSIAAECRLLKLPLE